ESAPPQDEAVERFWALASKVADITGLDVVVGKSELAALTPPAWSFGSTPEEADQLLALVLAGVKTATSSSLWERQEQGEEQPNPGDLSIICDGNGQPQVLVRIETVDVRPFDQVPAEHAAAEGEDDRSLEHWRRQRQREFTDTLAAYGRTFRADMPVVLETFTVLYPGPRRR
ncbi:ASCH domain-containing protein, partial [Georgenia ruanii]|uniref:ASCH domain-containing protein n=1 Tax=Georgenia ruanii TaxID=348442 RepID=UPI001D00D62C